MRLFRSKYVALLAVLLTLSIGVSSFAAGPIVQDSVRTAQGTVDAAAITVTLTDGSADVDIGVDLSAMKGRRIIIWDANGVQIQGYIYTDGAGTVQNIVSTKGGSTRNWAQQGAGFDDTTDCRYEIYKVLTAIPVSGPTNISAGAALLDLTATPFYGGAIDLSAYRDGSHIARFTLTSTGAMLGAAWISSTASAGEVLDGTDIFGGTGAFAASTGWTVPTGWSIGSGKATLVVNGNPYMYRTVSITSGALYKFTSDITDYSAGHVTHRLGNFPIPVAGWAGVSTNSSYITSDGTVVAGAVSPFENCNLSIDNLVAYKVTAPVATGCYLLATQGGAAGFINGTKSATWTGNEAVTLTVYYAGD